MKEQRHTPGPWEVDTGRDGAVIYKAKEGTVATLPTDLKRYLANAYLIAAAPEMLEALVSLVFVVETGAGSQASDWRLEQAKKVIKKIKGET